MPSPGVGGCDFAGAAATTDGDVVLWAAHALPSVVALTKLPADLADPAYRLPNLPLNRNPATVDCEQLIELDGVLFRLHPHQDGTAPPAVLLPLDQLFEIRAAAALRLWRALTRQRAKEGFPRLFGVVGLARDTLHREAPEFARDVDHIAIDGPPRVAGLMRSALLAAELALIPVQPSPFDGWASGEILRLIDEARLFRPVLAARFVLNRVRYAQ